MAKSDTRRTKGQAKPRKERDPPGAVRKGEDAKTSGGSGEGGRESIFRQYRGCATPALCAGIGLCRWPTICRHDQQKARRAESISPVGMETGANSGRPVGEGAEAKGGEREASVSERGTSIEPRQIVAEQYLPRGYYYCGVQWAARLGVIVTHHCQYFGAGYAYGLDEQERKAKNRTDRKAIAALLIGFTLGLLLPLAYQMVSRG